MPNPRANWWETGGGGSGGGSGSIPGTYSPAYGGIPNIPIPTTNMGELYGLTTGVASSGAANAVQNLNANVPGLAERSRGQLPQDVITQLLQQAAERGISTGMPGGPNSNAAYLRALGLTSLGVSTDAAHELEAGIARVPQVDPNRLIVSPEDRQAAETARAIYGSAPIPAAAAAASLQNAQSGIGAGQGSMNAGPWWSAAYNNMNSYVAPGMLAHW